MLGLLLGDAIGAARSPAPGAGVLAATSAGQLACFTVDGIIRAHVRGSHKGICHPPSVVWHAYTRWAAMQGIPGVKRWADENWPDGWLAEVPALAARRGSAPATVTALRAQVMGTPEKPVGSSAGAHGLTRCLPIGLIARWSPDPERLAAEVAATTHAVEATIAAALGVRLIAAIVAGQEIMAAAHDEPALRAAVAAAGSRPGQLSMLDEVAPDARAMSVLAGGVYAAVSFAGRAQVRDGLRFAASGAGGAHTAVVAGALLGAVHGVDALPVDWVSRLELGWVGDTLARDLLTEFLDRPSGGEYAPAADPHWWNRYPGW
jgi:hypothetical protein